MFHNLVNSARALRAHMRLPDAARAARRQDLSVGLRADPGNERVIDAGLRWLGTAQDHSASHDGGVARDYGLVDGWAASYPETTGYIVPTLLDCAQRLERPDLLERARRMLDWLVAIQLPDGGFQGGVIGATPVVPVTFNTGQILLGLAAGVTHLGERYRPAMERAGDWLVRTQDADGAWRRHPTPFAEPGEKVYETHVAWGLLEAARVAPDRGYGEAALRNIRWALTRQQPNGWFASNCLTDPSAPLTHTIGYVLRGVLEGHRFSGDAALLEAARRTADGVRGALRDDGWLPGRLDAQWRGTADWVCLTGNAQIAHCWLMLHAITGEAGYQAAARAALAFVRRTVQVDGPPETAGAVKGSFPVSGGYCTYQFPNWACKFLVDACLLDQDQAARVATTVTA